MREKTQTAGTCGIICFIIIIGVVRLKLYYYYTTTTTMTVRVCVAQQPPQQQRRCKAGTTMAAKAAGDFKSNYRRALEDEAAEGSTPVRRVKRPRFTPPPESPTTAAAAKDVFGFPSTNETPE